jgi:phosphoglycolate phosphatase
MTSSTQDDDALVGVLATTAPVLLDFDGPVTALMPGGVDRAIADLMRSVLHRAAGEVPVEIAGTNDPLAVLRVTAATQPTEILAAVEDVCRAGEIDAATHSEPTGGAHEAMRACRDAGRPIVIVSNNAAEAIETYLSRHALRDLVQAIVARPPRRPDLMKPDPYLIRQVFRHRAWPPSQYAFVGDSVTDVQASRRTGVRSIGYAETPQRGQELRDAGADAIITSMHDLSDGHRLEPGV